MRLTLLDKDQFACLIKFGELMLPGYSFSDISGETDIEGALHQVLKYGNPIEYPSQYIIVQYDNKDNDSRIFFSSIIQLIATDAESRHLFSHQFRDDLIIQPERYSHVFRDYLQGSFQKDRIQKGIIAFRSLCGLDTSDDYSEAVEIIHRGLTNRLEYRHHYDLPPTEREKPYSLMISYDRHAPYPNGWAGYYCDVIETYCYYKKPEMGYEEAVAEKTSIYNKVVGLGPSAKSKEINNAIKDEPFTQGCNQFFNYPGGYIVPFLFFVLRDKFRSVDSFSSHNKFIEQVKLAYPDAFDIACTFVGGFFGYDKFYEDYYSSLNLPFIRNNGILQTPLHEEPKERSVSKKKKVTDSTPAKSLSAVFLDGSPLFNELFEVIDSSLNRSKSKTLLLAGLQKHKDDEEQLQVIKGLLLSPIEKKSLLKEAFSISNWTSSIKTVRERYQQIKNQ